MMTTTTITHFGHLRLRVRCENEVEAAYFNSFLLLFDYFLVYLEWNKRRMRFIHRKRIMFHVVAHTHKHVYTRAHGKDNFSSFVFQDLKMAKNIIPDSSNLNFSTKWFQNFKLYFWKIFSSIGHHYTNDFMKTLSTFDWHGVHVCVFIVPFIQTFVIFSWWKKKTV